MSRRRGVFLAHCKRLATVVDPPAGQALWSELYGPAPTDVMLVIDQPVLLDIDALVHGLEIEGAGELIFDPDSSRLLQVDQQRPVCVMEGGHLEMVPASAAIIHELRFIDVDETLYTSGGGMEHTSNPGLCVENATVTLSGATKTGWTRTTHALSAGATSCTVVEATGWRVGDDIVIIPTEAATVPNHHSHHDRRTITAVAGNVISFLACTYPHPSNTSPIGGVVIYPEVINLTRNVKICGQDASHRAQIMFMENCTGSILEYFEGTHLGPRKIQPGSAQTQLIVGRYALHFHLMVEGSRDINVTGVVMHDVGSRAFVPHGSHGMTFYDCVAWEYFFDGYWWDTSAPIGAPRLPEDESNDLLYDKCFAGRGRFLDTNPGGTGMTGFFAGAGVNMTMRNCCAAAIPGATNTAGFAWPASLNHHPTNVWNFHDNDAHNNNEAGIFVWQNDNNVHDIDNFRGWNNSKFGVDHGAYGNRYHYNDNELWGNGVFDLDLHATTASTTGRRIEFNGGSVGSVRIPNHSVQVPGTPENPSRFTGVAVGTLYMSELGSNQSHTDFVECGMTPDDVTIQTMHVESIIRIQTGASAWKVTAPDEVTKTVVSIPLFA